MNLAASLTDFSDSDIIPSEDSLSAEQIWDFDHEESDSQDWLNALRDYQNALRKKASAKG